MNDPIAKVTLDVSDAPNDGRVLVETAGVTSLGPGDTYGTYQLLYDRATLTLTVHLHMKRPHKPVECHSRTISLHELVGALIAQAVSGAPLIPAPTPTEPPIALVPQTRRRRPLATVPGDN